MSRSDLLHTTIGQYEIVARIGAGATAEVFRGIRKDGGWPVAVKVLSSRATSTWSQRFLNEARLQAKLNHPNIARFHEVLEVDGHPCIVMEYIDGETLADRIARGPMPLGGALAVFEALVSAAAYIHDCGIIHRDFKPANIRITSAGVPKLLDFGIAKTETSPSLTFFGCVIGTPNYLSPEQFRTGKATPRSDLWSLGVVLYEMLTGRLPFAAKSLPELGMLVTRGTFISVSARMPVGPGASAAEVWRVDRMVARCLDTDPEQRFPSARALLREVHALQQSDHLDGPAVGSGWLTAALADARARAAQAIRRSGRLVGLLKRYWAVGS